MPKGARDYVEWVERRLGLSVSIVSVGKSREQTILRDKAFDWS
ncbi:MAG: adenylosuccinate synthetase [Chloroflexota bacterium]